jgi:BCD family chlorophyll transporter-like MFS transporter
MTEAGAFGWPRVVRLGLVQASLGAVVVLTTSTLNRVMVVELALPALLPGLLVALHYLVQMLRPRMGFGADVGGRQTPWILGGMAVLALGGVGAAAATAWMSSQRGAGITLAVLSFALIGVGVSACGTSLLVMLAKRVDAQRRAGAATVVWLMMIVGFAVTAGVAGRALDPYTPARLIAVSATVSALACLVSWLAMRGLEPLRGGLQAGSASMKNAAVDSALAGGHPAPSAGFAVALAEVWRDPVARRFTLFVFISMLAYSAQDLILEPFAGFVFGFTPGQSTSLSGVQHGGVLVGMLLAALAGRRVGGRSLGSLRAWTLGGCLLSALAMVGLAVSASVGPAWPFKANVFFLGMANGAFSIAAIGSMMRLAAEGGGAREGVRMGLWGAAQAVAFGLGGLLGSAASDLARWLIGEVGPAYAAVFAAEALLFVVAAALAGRSPARPPVVMRPGDVRDNTLLASKRAQAGDAMVARTHNQVMP